MQCRCFIIKFIAILMVMSVLALLSCNKQNYSVQYLNKSSNGISNFLVRANESMVNRHLNIGIIASSNHTWYAEYLHSILYALINLKWLNKSIDDFEYLPSMSFESYIRRNAFESEFMTINSNCVFYLDADSIKNITTFLTEDNQGCSLAIVFGPQASRIALQLDQLGLLAIPVLLLDSGDYLGASVFPQTASKSVFISGAGLQETLQESVQNFQALSPFSMLAVIFQRSDFDSAIEQGLRLVICQILQEIGRKSLLGTFTVYPVYVDAGAQHLPELAHNVDALFIPPTFLLESPIETLLLKWQNTYKKPVFSANSSRLVEIGALGGLSKKVLESKGLWAARNLVAVFNSYIYSFLPRYFDNPDYFSINLETARLLGVELTASKLLLFDSGYGRYYSILEEP